jgi:hypothetical protein
MRRQFTLPTVLALILLAGTVPEASATGGQRDSWLATYPDACQSLKDAATECFLCHGSGFALNGYGQDVADHGIVPAEVMDGDGDTVASGQEILDCTLPGDASSVLPSQSSSWGAIKILFR